MELGFWWRFDCHHCLGLESRYVSEILKKSFYSPPFQIVCIETSNIQPWLRDNAFSYLVRYISVLFVLVNPFE